MTGATLGHYRVLQKLGAGGMGEVYAAEDTKLGRRVALKLLPSDMAADRERHQRFEREARAVAALNHPNIVSIYSIEEADGVQFLTLELVEGKPLDAVIPEGGLPLADLLRLAVPLADAVAFAHEHGIVHRDLKPANIMLAEDGRLKVLDFGLAKLKPEMSAAATTTFLASESLTARHTVMGTAAYMSPEQAEGKAVDHRSDVFSLGVVLYEMACGRRPFGGDTVFSVISSIIKDTPAPVSAVNRAVPPALERLITRALAKDPAERYQSARDLCRELREVQEQAASLRVVSNLVRAVARSRWTRRVAVAAVLVAVVAAAVLYLVPRRPRSDQRTPTGVPQATFTRLTTAPGIEQFPSLTPDGKWVVYAGQEAGNWDIYIQAIPGQKPFNLTADSPADDDEPAVSPNGERIAFRSSRNGGGIWMMGIGGEGVKRVTPVAVSAAFNPAWSPDGTEIAYATENVQLTPLSWEGARPELWVVNVNTGAQRKLDVGAAVQATWSPNGHRIAYVARIRAQGGKATGLTDIHTVPARDGEPVAVTHDRWADWSPVWSPDGRYVYFASNRGGSMNLWRAAIDEISGKPLAEPQQITTPAPFLAHPSISADGRLIAYCAKVETRNIQKITLDPATGTVRGEPAWVTTGSGAWANPDPTGNGESVVAYSTDQPEGDLYVISQDGTRRQLTGEPEFLDRFPRWSPDGKWVAFFSNRAGGDALAVWKIRADGSELRQIAGQGGYPVWSPLGDRLAHSSAGVTLVVDPNRPWQGQTPQELPPPDEGLRPFSAQDWSLDGTRLAGQIGMGSSAKGIVIYTFASRSYERVTDFGEWPAWLPDSRQVLFVTRGKEYWVADTRTQRTQRVFFVTRDVLGPARLTRDGRAAFFPRRVTEADIYLLKFEG